MSENAKELVRRFYEEVIAAHEVDAADRFLADGFVDHELEQGDLPGGVTGFKDFFGAFFRGFPDLAVDIEDLIAEGDRVVARVRFSGTQHGEFMGVAPTGRSFRAEAIDILRIDGGRIVEHWGVFDQFAMVEQLAGAEAPATSG